MGLRPPPFCTIAMTSHTRTRARSLTLSLRPLCALLAALPPRYSEVLLGLLDRLETGALFTEESCSFSHKDLHDNLAIWADKADQQLQRG